MYLSRILGSVAQPYCLRGVNKTWARPWPGPWPSLWPTYFFFFFWLEMKEKGNEAQLQKYEAVNRAKNCLANAS